MDRADRCDICRRYIIDHKDIEGWGSSSDPLELDPSSRVRSENGKFGPNEGAIRTKGGAQYSIVHYTVWSGHRRTDLGAPAKICVWCAFVRDRIQKSWKE